MTRVLFVEDDPDQIMIYEVKFRLEGIDLTVATEEKEVFDALAKEKIDLILLDILIKEQNGLDILEKIRKEADFKKLPVIVFTNFDKKETRDRAESLGAIDYIIKAQTYPREMTEKIKAFAKTGIYTKGVSNKSV